MSDIDIDRDEFQSLGSVAERVVDDLVVNQWAAWRAMLHGEQPVLHSDDPASGYYRTRYKQGPWQAVAIWRDSNGLHVLLDGKPVTYDRVWPWCARRPISYETYVAVRELGEPWPDENAAVTRSNNAPPPDSIVAVRERIDDLAREAERLIAAGPAQVKDVADQASDLANSLAELSTRADKLREGEKAPHLQAGRDIDARWKPLVTRATDLKHRLKATVLTPFLVRLEAERQAAAVTAIAAGATPQVQRTVVGSSRRSTGLRTQVTAEVEDWKILLMALSEHPDIRDAAQRIANASAKAGVALPGTRISKDKVAV